MQHSVNVCDLPSQHDVLAREFADQAPAVRVFQDGHGVSRRSDYVIYCVEAENIDRVVQAYGPCKPPSSLFPILLRDLLFVCTKRPQMLKPPS